MSIAYIICLFFSEHEIKQRGAEVKLASRLVNEEEQFRRRKKMYPHLWQEKNWVDGLVSRYSVQVTSYLLIVTTYSFCYNLLVN